MKKLSGRELQVVEKFLAEVEVDYNDYNFINKLCFYMHENKCERCVSKYFQTKALKFLFERRETLEVGEYNIQFGAWWYVIELDKRRISKLLNMA